MLTNTQRTAKEAVRPSSVGDNVAILRALLRKTKYENNYKRFSEWFLLRNASYSPSAQSSLEYNNLSPVFAETLLRNVKSVADDETKFDNTLIVKIT